MGYGFALVSIVLVGLWFGVIKPKMRDRTRAGMSREAVLGQIGVVVLASEGEQRGRLRFAAPILGSDEWEFKGSDPVACGERVMVQELAGNTLVVVRHEPQLLKG